MNYSNKCLYIFLFNKTFKVKNTINLPPARCFCNLERSTILRYFQKNNPHKESKVVFKRLRQKINPLRKGKLTLSLWPELNGL